MWNLKISTNKSICKTETNSQTQNINIVTEEGAGGKSGVWHSQMHTPYIKQINKITYVEHRELYSISYNKYNGKV